MEETLYKEEQRLSNKLVESEGTNAKEYQGALKRTIDRINKEMKLVEKEDE